MRGNDDCLQKAKGNSVYIYIYMHVFDGEKAMDAAAIEVVLNVSW